MKQTAWRHCGVFLFFCKGFVCVSVAAGVVFAACSVAVAVFRNVIPARAGMAFCFSKRPNNRCPAETACVACATHPTYAADRRGKGKAV